jgi:prepilin-type N-terminal cleavage/methylation domain-containing protein
MWERRNGFTLIELMIVVAIIGILASIAIPKFAELIRKSNEGKSKGNLGAIRSALSIYYADNEGSYPTDHLEALTQNGKYIDKLPASETPPYHASSANVSNNDDLGMGAMPFSDSGGWVYWNWTAGMTGYNQGDLWVSCVHTDTKSSVWSAY